MQDNESETKEISYNSTMQNHLLVELLPVWRLRRVVESRHKFKVKSKFYKRHQTQTTYTYILDSKDTQVCVFIPLRRPKEGRF